MKRRVHILVLLEVKQSVLQKIIRFPELIVEILLRPIADFCVVELSPPCQLIRPRIEQHHSVALDLRLEVMRFGKCVVKVLDSVVYELRMRMKRPVLVLEKAILDFFVQRVLHRSDRFAGEDYDVVVAHVVSRRSELYALVVIHVFVLGVTAEQHDHFDLLDLFKNKRG